MRFETLTGEKQIAFLQRLHKTINRKIFKGELAPLQNTPKDINPDFITRLGKLDTQKEQAKALVRAMLHEMVHQYCAKNDIDDRNHSEQWQRAAADHWLHSVYSQGQPVEEWINTPAVNIANSLRLK